MSFDNGTVSLYGSFGRNDHTTVIDLYAQDRIGIICQTPYCAAYSSGTVIGILWCNIIIGPDEYIGILVKLNIYREKCGYTVSIHCFSRTGVYYSVRVLTQMVGDSTIGVQIS